MTMHNVCAAVLAAVLGLACAGWPSTAARAGDAAQDQASAAERRPERQAGVGDYIAGSGGRGGGDNRGAPASLSKAIEADEENADYVRARGVARTLAEDFPGAIRD